MRLITIQWTRHTYDGDYEGHSVRLYFAHKDKIIVKRIGNEWYRRWRNKFEICIEVWNKYKIDITDKETLKC